MVLKRGNSKLGKKVLAFNLPPLKTCTPSKWCKEHCYAQKGRFTFPVVKQSSENSYEKAKTSTFESSVIDDIKRTKTEFVRIHASGDFFSASYVNKWYNIAKECKDTKFLAFTRRGDLKEAILKLESLPNVVIYESMDDSLKTRKIPEIPPASITGCSHVRSQDRECNMGCEECNFLCWDKVKDKGVYFHVH